MTDRAQLSLAEVLDQFSRAMRSAGLVTDADIVADGKLHRFRVEGDKAGTKNGWYVLHSDGIAAGQFGNWKADKSETWCADVGRKLTKDEDAAHRARVKAMREQRDAELVKVREIAAARAADTWGQASKRGADPAHPYLVAKGVGVHGIGQLRDALVVPVKAGKRLVGLQFIQADGSKKFLTGTPKRGAFHMVGAVGSDVPVLAVAEGYATAATVHEATGWPVAVAFDAGNLEPVARAMRKARPSARLVVAADNDHRTAGNPGITKAQVAAEAVGGVVIAPEFEPDDNGTDWNDYATEHGRDATREALLAGLEDGRASAPEATPSQPPAARKGKRSERTARNSEAGPLRSGYELRDDGLYWCDVDYRDGEARPRAPMFLASPLQIEAVTRDMRGRKHGRLLTFTDIDGNPKTWNMPARLLAGGRGDELRAALLEEGLPAISLEPNAQRRLLMYLMRRP